MTTWSDQSADEQSHQLLVSQRMDAVNQLAAGAAHEFNNVLQIIRGYVAVVQQDLAPETQSYEDLDHAIEAADRAAELAERLLRFARSDDEPGVWADVDDAAQSLRMLLRPIIGENIQIRVDVEPGLPQVAVGEASLRQALLNLCVNARDAMPEGGELLIEATRSDSARGAFEVGAEIDEPCVCVAVADSGEGMSREVVDRLFEPFFTTKPPGEGTGLGLPMVASCVQSAGGALRVVTEPGAGSRFEVYLPLAVEPVEASPEEIVFS